MIRTWREVAAPKKSGFLYAFRDKQSAIFLRGALDSGGGALMVGTFLSSPLPLIAAAVLPTNPLGTGASAFHDNCELGTLLP